MKVSELQGAALRWAVGMCTGLINGDDLDIGFINESGFDPLEDWAQGGPIIERERIAVWGDGGLYWEAECGWAWGKGPTPLVAAMRCYVSSKVGEEIEVPDELKQGEIA